MKKRDKPTVADMCHKAVKVATDPKRKTGWHSSISKLPVTTQIEPEQVYKLAVTVEVVDNATVLIDVKEHAQNNSRHHFRDTQLRVDRKTDKWFAVLNKQHKDAKRNPY